MFFCLVFGLKWEEERSRMERVVFGILDSADIPRFGNNDMANKNLTSAKRAKNDEFYTQYDNYDAR